VVLLVLSFVIVGCGGGNETPKQTSTSSAPAVTTTTTSTAAQSTSTAPVSTSAVSTSPAASSSVAPSGQPPLDPQVDASKIYDKTPVSGGIIKEIWSSGPSCLSYWPEMGPNEETGVMPAEEKLMEYGWDHDIHPFLAEQVITDPEKKTITFKIRKGIKFSDGSDLNAEVVAWNYKVGDETNKLQYNDRLESIEVVDQYTMVLHLNAYDRMLLSSFGWVPIFSKAAWDKAGSTDEERKVWARNHIVGTGPFILKEYVKDDHMTWVKNPNYWQKGKPYLDGIEIKFVPDAVVAAAMMQAGQADMWQSGSTTKTQKDLVAKGLKLMKSSGTPITIYPNNADPASKFANQALREAVEYAIDKVEIAKALGMGDWFPLENGSGPDMWGYDANFKGRQYSVAKAKEKLAEAGYPNGVQIKMTALTGWEDQAQAIKQYLDAAGIQTEIDMADAGRFFSMYWGKAGWTDLLLFLQASSPNAYACLHRTIGPEPKTEIASFIEGDELTQMFKDSRKAETIDEMKAWVVKIQTYIADKALLIPLWESPQNYVVQQYVQTTYLRNSVVARFCADDWMEPKK
jgi:ABC-type transport system substrate-binding protein